MRFAILGPVEFHDGAAFNTPRANKLRTLLATLLVRANTVVSVDALMNELWGTQTPPSALRALRVYVSQLRKMLAASDGSGDTIVTQPPGYRLEVTPGSLDALDFEALCASAREAWTSGNSELAADEYRAALRLWRGPALADVRTGPVLSGAAMRLDEAWITAVERRIDADLRLGRHRDLVSELRGLVADHPMNEGLHARLMVALYRSGRTRDALEVYQVVRKHLMEELAVEPGAELRQIHRAVLQADRSLHAVEPQPQQHAPASRPARRAV